MKKFSVLVVALLMLATPLFAQVTPPTIGVYFDQAGTQTEAPCTGAGDYVTAYIIAKGGQMFMGGTSFALEVQSDIQIVAANLVAGAVEIPSNPDLTAGVELGLYDATWVDADHPLILYSLILTCADRPLGNLPITVVNHPNYTNVVVAQNDGTLFDTTGGTAYLTPPPPVVGVFFDTDATVTTATYNGGNTEFYTAYIYATGGPLLLGGASFKLDLDPAITLVTANYPPSVQIGDLLNGVEIGLYDAQFMDPQHPVQLATLILTTGHNLVDNAPLCIVNHPNYQTVVLSDNDGNLEPGDGACAYLTIPVANEARTWSDVKDLYR